MGLRAQRVRPGSRRARGIGDGRRRGGESYTTVLVHGSMQRLVFRTDFAALGESEGVGGYARRCGVSFNFIDGNGRGLPFLHTRICVLVASFELLTSFTRPMLLAA